MNKIKQTKRYLILLLFGFIIISCEKEDIYELKNENFNPISKADAEIVAINFANSKNSTARLKSSSFTDKEIKEVMVIPNDANEPALYIVNLLPTGFVIISATKNEFPILGFSDEATFSISDAPLGLREWIELRIEKIEILKGDNIVIPLEVEDEWMKLIEPDPDYDPELDPDNRDYSVSRTIEKGPLMTTLWGQGYGYNTLLDPIDGQLPPTGCVVTATAQIMKYHQYPNSYNWSAMPNTYGTTTTAQLMKDIGVVVGMNYSLDGSGAKTENAKNALVNNFGYSSVASYQDYNVNTVVSEINASRPVIFDGYATKDDSDWWIFEQTTYKDGHAWVCDGYRINELYKRISGTVTSRYIYLHMNWGWGYSNRNYNGYFASNNFTINFNDGTSMSYKYKNQCIINIHP